MWFNLAAMSGSRLGGSFREIAIKAATQRDKLAQFMTPSQIARAQKLAREWRPKTANVPVEEIERQSPAPEKN
jgi:hypothetical protein